MWNSFEKFYFRGQKRSRLGENFQAKSCPRSTGLGKRVVPTARGSQEMGFTQPRDHSFVQPYTKHEFSILFWLRRAYMLQTTFS